MISCCSIGALAFDDGGGFYRDEAGGVSAGASCGSLCISSPNYYQSYLFQKERNLRLYSAQSGESQKNDLDRNKLNALNFRSYNSSRRMSGFSWSPNSKVSRSFVKYEVQWSRVARDAGFQVAENGKSLASAFFRELRKPILFNLRDRITGPYKSKKLSLSEKTQLWIIEQAVDSGAGTLNLESYGGFEGSAFNTDFGIKRYTLRVYPRVDPLKGKYGMRLGLRRYLSRARPVDFAFNTNYCSSATGLKNDLCGYEHEISTSYSYSDLKNKWSFTVYVSYQTRSLDDDYYIIDGQLVEHVRWLSGMRMTYAFY